MFRRFKIAYKKVHSFLFGQENEHIHTRQELKKYYGRIKTDTPTEARMIHQYPQQGQFRFPVMVDEPNKTERDQIHKKSDRTYTRKQSSTPVPVKQVQPNDSGRKLKEKERKKFQGVNFKARSIPSPVYGFQPPPKRERKLTVLEEEATNLDQMINWDSIVGEEEIVEFSPNGEINTNTVKEQFTYSVEQNEQLEEDEFSWNKENDIEDQTAATTEQDVIGSQHVEDQRSREETIENNENYDRVSFSNEHESHHQATLERVVDNKIEQLEQFPGSVNTIIKDKEVTSKKTVVPFNVLMFHKDRLALKTQETKQERSYQFPTIQLLNIPPRQPENSHEWLEEKREILELTLANFNVQAKVVGITRGPSVTRFEIQPDPGVKVSKITGLTDDIKLSLAAKDIRMEAPIPGKNAIGIEVPNDVSDPVVIREILRSSEFQKNPSPLTVAMGLDIEGKPIVTDIQKMPHGLIAGATGSGKSVCINSILISIMFKATPDEVKLLLVDPKMVELAPYNDIPHLVTPVITDAKQATIALKWAVEEMERRYELFVQNGVRDIKRYNDVMKKGDDDTPAMPYIVIVIDELADLMMVSPHDVEEAICRIAQKARACGIHLLLATQRPSVDVITGLIKANIPTRIAFSVSSQADSRTIIDAGGAERLLGKGDMLLFENGASKPVRVQGNFVSDEEIDRVIALVKKQREPNYLFDKDHLVKSYEGPAEMEDDLFEEACYYVLEQGGASSSSLQRRFRIGFNRAARLIDMMEVKGIISEAMGSKPRNVLVSEEELQDRM